MAENNEQLKRARESIPSRRSPGACLGRQELADLVNEWIYRHRGQVVALDKNYIGKLERGQIHWPDEPYRAALRAVLGASSDAQLGFYDTRRTPRDVTPAEVERFLNTAEPADVAPPTVAAGQPPVGIGLLLADPQDRAAARQLDRLELRRQQVLDAVTVGTVTGAGIEEWERTVLRHGRATRYRPAPQMLSDLEGDLADLQRMLAGHHTSSTLRVLTRLTAQMAGLVFLTLIKLNRPGIARVWARTARVAADEAGDPATCSWVWAQEAYVCFYEGNLVEAVEVARHAQELAGRTAAVGVPLAAALEARAQAMLGQQRETLSALRRAEAALARLESDAVTPSAFGYNEAQLRFHEGNALTHLRNTAAAQASQRRALELYPPEDFLDRALVGLDQATCLAHQGSAEAAAESATRAMANLTGEQRAGLVSARCRQLLAVLHRQHAATPGTHELRDLLAQDTENERMNI